MRRKAYEYILKDLTKKMVFLVGPRQVGKTWLAKEILKEYKNPLYLNFDNIEHREVIKKQGWLKDVDLLVFDEIHKMPKWKNYLKGVFDTRRENMHILVTGSARLDAFRKAGDSLVGRFFVHHLFPFTLGELQGTEYGGNIERLLSHSGFPEPFLSTENEVGRWRDLYADSFLKMEVLDFQDVDKINAIKQVFDILRFKVGSNISYSNIGRDVGISPITVKKYIEILEALFIVFIIKPYTKKINRSILKEPKIYFYDTGLIKDFGAQFENLVALSLYTKVIKDKDILGKNKTIGFLKTKEQKEVDFVLVDENGEMEMLYEAKLSDSQLSSTLKYFSEKYNVAGIQIVKNINMEKKINEKCETRDAVKFLSNL